MREVETRLTIFKFTFYSEADCATKTPTRQQGLVDVLLPSRRPVGCLVSVVTRSIYPLSLSD
jgi:hypothetical protein